MKVIKRDGHSETLKLDKITNRIKKQTYGLDTEYVDSLEVATKVVSGIYDGINTQQLDLLAAETAAVSASKHYHACALLALRAWCQAYGQ